MLKYNLSNFCKFFSKIVLKIISTFTPRIIHTFNKVISLLECLRVYFFVADNKSMQFIVCIIYFHMLSMLPNCETEIYNENVVQFPIFDCIFQVFTLYEKQIRTPNKKYFSGIVWSQVHCEGVEKEIPEECYKMDIYSVSARFLLLFF